MTTKITPAPAYQRPSGKLYLLANQLNLVSGVWTLVELDTITTGFTDGIEDTTNHRITPSQAGFYDVKGRVTFDNTVADTLYYAAVRLNGSAYKSCERAQASVAGPLSVSCHALLYLSATDFLELMGISLAGVNTVDIQEYERYTFLSLQRVR